MKKLSMVLLIFTSFSLSSPAVAEPKISKSMEADVKQLLELTGALRIGQQMSQFFVAQLSQSIKASRSDIPQEMFTILAEEVNRVVDEALNKKGGFIDLVIPLYGKYFSQADIKALIRFYQSEIGKKTIKVMPNLLQESMTLGQQWGQNLGPVIQQRVMKRFKEKGYDLSV
jgi:hypothetical protein